MGDFSFAGQHSTSYQVKLLKSPVSVLSGTRDKVIILPGRHGSLRMSPDLGERLITLDCWLEANSLAQLHTRFDAVRAWLNSLRGEQRLIFDVVPDRYHLAAYAGGGLEAEIVARQGRFAVDFVCPDPFAYAISPDVVTITTSPYNHMQRGTAPAEPILRLQGISTALGGQEISITINAQIVTYRGVLAAGEWLEIDCKDKTVVRVVGANRTSVIKHMVKPIFPQLAAGTNPITVVPAGGAVWSRLDIHCRNRWL